MTPFHVTIHTLPAAHTQGETVEILGRRLQTLQVPQAQLGTPFEVTFEEVVDAFEQLPRMFAEPDGSFVWRGSVSTGDWQLDGQLSDRNGQLIYAEVKGTATQSILDQLLGALGWPETPLVFQFVQAGVLVDETELRKLLFG